MSLLLTASRCRRGPSPPPLTGPSTCTCFHPRSSRASGAARLPSAPRQPQTVRGALAPAASSDGEAVPQKALDDKWKLLLGEELWAPEVEGIRIGAIQTDECIEVADLQASAFHTPFQWGLMNAVAYNSFRAEVRASLGQKLKYSPPGSFCCLVAKNEGNEVVGVVEVSLQSDKEVLARIGSSAGSTYAYIASMAVREQDRRTGVASALLSAAEQVAGRWQQSVAVLDVHEDNFAAVRLYTSRGWESNSRDPGWVSMVGKRRKLRMQKMMEDH